MSDDDYYWYSTILKEIAYKEKQVHFRNCNCKVLTQSVLKNKLNH